MTGERWHGTAGGYSNHGCRCAPCTGAHAATHDDARAMAQIRFKADPRLAKHGTESTYGYWGCRCAECSKAKAAANHRRKAKAAANHRRKGIAS